MSTHISRSSALHLPCQVSEIPSPAQAEKQQAVSAAAAAAGFSEGDLQDLKAMMTAMKGAPLGLLLQGLGV